MRAAAARQLLPLVPSPLPSIRRSSHMAAAAAAAAADPGTAYKLLITCPAGLPRSRVSVKFDPSFDRIPHPDASLEEAIGEIWNQRLQQNPSLYNGTKFRTEPVFIGVSRREMNVRPTAFFFTKCNIDSSTVTELYSRAQDGYESTKLYAVSMEELRGMSQQMPGCHHGGFALYELMRNAAEKS